MAQIYLVRHTTPKVKKGICYGISDVPVEKTFEQEAANVVKTIENIVFKAVYSSPLKRCTLLANSISPNSFITDTRLLELNFGFWELQPWDKIYKTSVGKMWMENYVETQCPGGEAYIDLVQRVIRLNNLNSNIPLDFYNFIQNTFEPNDNILVVAHAGVIRAMLAITRNIPLIESFELKMGFGEVFKL